MARPIDVEYLGYDRVICAHEVDGALVDPGPASSIETVLAALGAEPRALLLTHIHLDHAGAAGVLVRRFPKLPVYVHERGARHLVDPAKLLSSAARLYGEDRMAELWGEVAPVPEGNIRALAGGERVLDAFTVAATPGHASHHVCYLHEPSGDAYVGDMAGVRIPPSPFTLVPTPPPDIDVEAWLLSLETIAAWRPERLCLTHFGCVDEVEPQLAAVRERLGEWAQLARTLDGEAFVEAVTAQVRAATDADTAERFVRAAPPGQLYLGLERYWRKRAERERGEAA